MADEVTINASVTFQRSSDAAVKSAQVVDRLQSPATLKDADIIQAVGTSEEPINLGDVATVGAFMLKNLDPTNYIDIKVGTGGAIFARLRPDTQQNDTGGICLISELGSGAQSPYAIANTATCNMAIFLLSQ